MTVLVLHLSDIHIKSVDDSILTESANIAACSYSELADASQVFIAVSGDIAYSGKKQQYDLAETFLRQIESCIRKEFDGPISFVISPGNHDNDFERENATRRSVIENLVNAESPEIDDSIVESCTVVQEPFFQFRDRLQNLIDDGSDRLWYSATYEIENKRVIFECINVSWVSRLKEVQGQLYFPISQYGHKQDNPPDVRLTIMHHPLNWYTQSMYRPFRIFLRDISSIIFTGHEHRGNYGVLDEAESGQSAFVEGGVLQTDGSVNESAFNLVSLNLDKGLFTCRGFTKGKNGYEKAAEEGWQSYLELPTKRAREFELLETFQEVLDDPGAFIETPGKLNVAISDIYVYPDLREEDKSDEERRTVVSSKVLHDVERIGDGVVIKGEEKAGCTTLLHQLFRYYYDRGYVPVILEGRTLKRATSGGVDSSIRRALGSQYKNQPVRSYEQLSKSRKIILIDRLDESPIRSELSRARLVSELRKRTDNLVITVGELFEVAELLTQDGFEELWSMSFYQLESFNYSRRTELIQKWYRLEQDESVDEALFVAKCEQAEQLMDSVMKKGVVPPLPLYFLTLLQSIESGRGGDFIDSSLGYYYQYLLTEAFNKSRVPPDRLTEVFDYVTQLAWEYHQKRSELLTELELREFNDKFSKTWHTVDFERRIKLLEQARVLRRIGDEFRFRYPYIYYFLKGRYLSQNLSDIDNRSYIAHCCEHLYVRDHANTILFLAHHTNDIFVLQTVSDRVNALFANRSPVTFEGDTKGVENLVSDAPKLRYSGESPSVHRKKRSALRDEFEEDDDGLTQTEEESAELSIPAELTVLFRTTEILGQILKNQYSSIKRPDKADLIKELFDAPLRALTDCYEFFQKHPDSLVSEIEAEISRHGNPEEVAKKDRIARQVVATLILGITAAFLVKTAVHASSEALSEDVRAVVKGRGSVAYKLLELAIRLNSPKPIPRTMLESFRKDNKKDLIAEKLIQFLVVQRLYMYKTSESDMQWLSGKMKFDIGLQHEIAYKPSSPRRLN